MLVVTELFNNAINDFDAKKSTCCRGGVRWTCSNRTFLNMAVNDLDTNESTRCRWVLVVTELVVSEKQCISVVSETAVGSNFIIVHIMKQMILIFRHSNFYSEISGEIIAKHGS